MNLLEKSKEGNLDIKKFSVANANKAVNCIHVRSI